MAAVAAPGGFATPESLRPGVEGREDATSESDYAEAGVSLRLFREHRTLAMVRKGVEVMRVPALRTGCAGTPTWKRRVTTFKCRPKTEDFQGSFTCPLNSLMYHCVFCYSSPFKHLMLAKHSYLMCKITMQYWNKAFKGIIRG